MNAIYTPDVNNEQSDENLGKPLIDMIQTGNNMQIRRVKDCQAEMSTLDSTPNPKSTCKYLLLSVSGEFLHNCLAVCLYFVVQTFCEICLLYFIVDRHCLGRF
jgi:hypothetical protein